MKTDETARGPLSGVLVVDLATERAELAGRVLADLGADVVKVEPPAGAAARRLPPFAHNQPRRVGDSLYWAAVALGKRSIVVDLTRPQERERLLKLLAVADIAIESFDPGTLEAYGLDWPTLHSLNPALILVSITPYGQDGPEAHSPATELTLEAAGGLLGLQGDGDRPPVPVGFPQAAFHAGIQAAADAVIALCERQRSGQGQYLDVSMQATMVWTLMNATGFPPLTGDDPPGTGEGRAGSRLEPVPGLSLPLVWECADGAVHGVLGAAGRVGGHTFQALIDWLAEEGALEPSLRSLDWTSWLQEVVAGRLSIEQANRAIQAIVSFSRCKTKAELMARARRDRLFLAPVYTVDEVVNDQQLQARCYWQTIGDRLYPGPFCRMSRTPVRLRSPAPDLGQDQELLDRSWPRPLPPSAATTRKQAFEGLRVADFSWVGVGPLIGKALADHGATVVRVETIQRPDILRLLPPFKDNVPGIDRSFTAANFNTSKLGLALNWSSEQGRALARRLVHWAEVVVESFTPGTLEQVGLDYDSLREERPDLIMLSTSLRGATGPECTYSGFGAQGAALAGIHGITGWPDRVPCGPWGPYTDVIAPRYGVAALGAALYYRNKTGLGQHIDLSQVEASIHFIEPLILDYTVNRRVAQPAGHDSPRACPHGVYRAAGTERYVALAVETAEQWRALCAVAPLEGFHDACLERLEERLARRQELDEALRPWIQAENPWDLAQRLKRAGVPAAVVLRPSDLYQDPQLRHRGFFITLEHPVMGAVPFNGFATRFSATPPRLRRAAPSLGQDTAHVLRELLGMSEAEIAELAAAGALT